MNVTFVGFDIATDKKRTLFFTGVRGFSLAEGELVVTNRNDGVETHDAGMPIALYVTEGVAD